MLAGQLAQVDHTPIIEGKGDDQQPGEPEERLGGRLLRGNRGGHIMQDRHPHLV